MQNDKQADAPGTMSGRRSNNDQIENRTQRRGKQKVSVNRQGPQWDIDMVKNSEIQYPLYRHELLKLIPASSLQQMGGRPGLNSYKYWTPLRENGAASYEGVDPYETYRIRQPCCLDPYKAQGLYKTDRIRQPRGFDPYKAQDLYETYWIRQPWCNPTPGTRPAVMLVREQEKKPEARADEQPQAPGVMIQCSNPQNFEEFMMSQKPVVVYFFSTSVGQQTLRLASDVNLMAQQHPDVTFLQVNVDDPNMKTVAKQYGLEEVNTPTFVFQNQDGRKPAKSICKITDLMKEVTKLTRKESASGSN